MPNSSKTLINLGASPTPRANELQREPPNLRVKTNVPLPLGGPLPTTSFFDVVKIRRTKYGGRRLDLAQVSTLLRNVAYARRESSDAAGKPIRFRPVASAGARHAIDIGVCRIKGRGNALYLYDDLNHRLQTLSENRDLGAWLSAYASTTTFGHHGTLFWFLAETGRTDSKYAHAESLIWRDAGALIQQFYLVATALGLQAVALGATAEPDLSSRIVPKRARFGVGGMYVGSPA